MVWIDSIVNYFVSFSSTSARITMKLCAVVGCSNGSYQLDKWKQGKCSKHQTFNGLGCCDCDPPFHLFPFPTEKQDQDGRRRWNKLMNQKDQSTGKNWINKPHDRVCSKHFPDGKPTLAHPDPVLHLGYKLSPQIAPKRAPPRDREEPTKSRKRVCRTPTTSSTPSPSIGMAASVKVEEDHRYTYKCDCKPSCDCVGCIQKQAKIISLEHRVKELQHKLISRQTENKGPKSCRKKLICAENISTDKDVNHCTGISSKQAFEDMYKFVEPHAKTMSYWKSAKCSRKGRPFKGTPKKSGPRRKLQLKDEFLLVLMRLRLDLTVQFLALLFGIVSSTCSQIITTWLRFLAMTLKPLIVWPNRSSISLNMPIQFRKHCRNIRSIIDCTEIFIERPRSLDLQASTWSDYKKHNTIKVLVGITPNGHISFLSKAYGGRASDVAIFRESGFLSLLDPNDVVMADRGFPIQEELLLHHATLEIPPAAQGKRQMTRSKVQKTKVIANLRIHVERAINRLKDFKILNNTMPLTLVPSADDILIVCAALVNLQPDLIK
ncbi:uncharacterized protein [Diadema antillarum]|uniref:uncharacterized protein n=1 Tax=Diadema antillarum TaxID=105358 RepID=UPI003A86B5C2